VVRIAYTHAHGPSTAALFFAKQLFHQSSHVETSGIRAVIIWLGCNDSIQLGQKQHVSRNILQLG
jgi:hypothetical protein